MTTSPSQRGAASGALVATLTASIALGAAGSVLAYRTVAGPTVESSVTQQPAIAAGADPAVAAETARERPRARWAPCRVPAKLEKGVCVTEVVREVVVPQPAAPSDRSAPAARSGQPARADRRGRSGDAGTQDEERRSGRDDERDDDSDHEREDETGHDEDRDEDHEEEHESEDQDEDD